MKERSPFSISIKYRSTGSTVDYTDYNDYFYGYTQNGEIRLIYDDDGGIVARYSYDAWGNVISIYGNYANPVGTDNAIRYKGWFLGISITIPTIYGVSIKTYTSTYDIYTAVGVGFSYPSSVGIFATASYYLYAGSITLPQSFVSRLRKETQGLNP